MRFTLVTRVAATHLEALATRFAMKWLLFGVCFDDVIIDPGLVLERSRAIGTVDLHVVDTMVL
jgi:hypothetical protein